MAFFSRRRGPRSQVPCHPRSLLVNETVHEATRDTTGFVLRDVVYVEGVPDGVKLYGRPPATPPAPSPHRTAPKG